MKIKPVQLSKIRTVSSKDIPTVNKPKTLRVFNRQSLPLHEQLNEDDYVDEVKHE